MGTAISLCAILGIMHPGEGTALTLYDIPCHASQQQMQQHYLLAPNGSITRRGCWTREGNSVTMIWDDRPAQVVPATAFKWRAPPR